MVHAITDSVKIELLIEGERNKLYQKIIRKKPPDPGTYKLNSEASTFKTPPTFQDKPPPWLSKEITSAVALNSENQGSTSIQASSFRSDSINPEPPRDNKSFGYYIEDSYLSEDNSERVFRVRYEETERYSYAYYAFKFKDYIICPAFLVDLLNVKKFACLSVTNTIKNYYILLKKVREIMSCFLPVIMIKNS
jgi:hypothetical protein